MNALTPGELAGTVFLILFVLAVLAIVWTLGD